MLLWLQAFLPKTSVQNDSSVTTPAGHTKLTAGFQRELNSQKNLPTLLICHCLPVTDFQTLIMSCAIDSRNDTSAKSEVVHEANFSLKVSKHIPG